MYYICTLVQQMICLFFLGGNDAKTSTVNDPESSWLYAQGFSSHVTPTQGSFGSFIVNILLGHPTMCNMSFNVCCWHVACMRGTLSCNRKTQQQNRIPRQFCISTSIRGRLYILRYFVHAAALVGPLCGLISTELSCFGAFGWSTLRLMLNHNKNVRWPMKYQYQ